jgi:hypothetical protein
MKVISWIIALCGLWEFGDIVAFFVPDLGHVPAFVWNHIIVGIILLLPTLSLQGSIRFMGSVSNI